MVDVGQRSEYCKSTDGGVQIVDKIREFDLVDRKFDIHLCRKGKETRPNHYYSFRGITRNSIIRSCQTIILDGTFPWIILTALRSSLKLSIIWRIDDGLWRFRLLMHLWSGIAISLVCCGTVILRVSKETTVNVYLYRKGKEKRPNLIYFSIAWNPPSVLWFLYYPRIFKETNVSQPCNGLCSV